MFKKVLLTLAFILPFASQAATTDTTKLIKQCETKYKADKQKKMDCIAKVKKSASKSTKKEVEKAKKTSSTKVADVKKDAKKDVKATSSKLDSKKADVKKSSTKTKTAVKKQLKAVNVNTASASDLAASLPGIGETKAKAIVDYRKKHGKFKSAKDLEKVTGLGEKSVSSMKKYLKF
ncbi:ComEA family DNA-binding protein [Photobacterium leiognathi]|nr:helix-hairpin-helix domain-containing protein [Photobacterium leiognathi]GAA06317.1 competence ComEA helix-hairpin-helix repeat region domain protein [Photobacterium leiognathi subsp. mandapamensis svers.1.1.]MCG3884192.1 helix-hairpin-helix domain-containing protein [Photobacterium leiognathi]PHZ60454.1 competence protein ComEA [Photobacterium leiognathi]PSW44610.1 helix-hairpin-helix domain-containing protein [Photobacterium leiognathi subsp. mandapamensis]PSW55091.1 helix-hairpin-helix d